jgi:hypothetical protein
MNRLVLGTILALSAVLIAVALFGYVHEISEVKTPGPTPSVIQPQENETKSKIDTPMNVNLSISGIPSLNMVVKLMFTATPLENAPNTTVQILLPDEFVLVAGDLFWNGDLAKNETILLNASVKAVKVGDYVIKASAISEGQWTFGKSDSLYISVFETTATISDKVPINNWVNKAAIPLSQNGDEISANLSLSSLPLLNKEVRLVFTVTPLINLSNVQVDVVLPEKGMEIVEIKPLSKPSIPSEFTHPSGLDVLGNQLTWKGDIANNETLLIEVVVKSIVTGEGYLYGSVHATRHDNMPMVKTVQLDISVTEWSATVNTSYPSVSEIDRGTTDQGIIPSPLAPTKGNK